MGLLKLTFALGFLALSSTATYACDRYFITYVENETDLQGFARKTVLGIQREDFKTIFANGTRPLPSKCQFYINGYDLIKDKNGKSKLTKIYEKIAKDGKDSPIDLLTLTHGAGDAEIEIAGGDTITVEEAFFNDMPANLKSRLGVFADFACWGIGSSQNAIDAGFTAALGVDETSLGPLLTRDFMTNYIEGKPLWEIAEELYDRCMSEEIWGLISKVVADDREQYCRDAAVLIRGNADITIDTTNAELKQLRSGAKTKAAATGSYAYRAHVDQKTPFITKAEGTVRIGDNSVNQIDLYTNNSFITRFSLTSTLDYGYQFGLLNQPHAKILSFERDPKNSVLFSFTALSFEKNIFSIGKKYDNGLSWKYNLSVEGKAGYLKVRDADGQVQKLANVGAAINNELKVGYRALNLETNAGIDYLVFHNMGRQYLDGSLSYNKGRTQIGAYGTMDSLVGTHGGVRATFDIGKKKKKKN